MCIRDSNRCEAKRYTPDQQAVIELAKENKKGISPTESNILVDWAKEYGIKSHYAKTHPTRSGYWSDKMHIKIANIHIPLLK